MAGAGSSGRKRRVKREPVQPDAQITTAQLIEVLRDAKALKGDPPPELIEWLIERPRIEDDLRRTVRVGTPRELRDSGLDVSHNAARRLLARIDRLKDALHRGGWIVWIFRRSVEVLTVLAFLVIVFALKGIDVDRRLVEIAHWEAPAGVVS